MPQTDVDFVRKIAREEIASLAGLVLRRLQDEPDAPLAQKIAGAFGEALRDFGGTSAEPGPPTERSVP